MSDLPQNLTEEQNLDPQTQARLSGYSWGEIDDHIAQSTSAAVEEGYGQRDIDEYLGYKDPGGFEARARSSWAARLADDPSKLQSVANAAPDLSGSETADEYKRALLDREVKGPQDFSDRYAAAALDAAHGPLGLQDDGTDARLVGAAKSADALAAALPDAKDLTDAAISIAAQTGGDIDQIKRNLMDHWQDTGQPPLDAAVKAQTDPTVADDMAAPPQVDQRSLLGEFWSQARGSLAKGIGFPIERGINAVLSTVGEATGSEAIKSLASEENTATIEAMAREAELSKPDTTFLGSPLHSAFAMAGGLVGAVGSFAAGPEIGIGLAALGGAEDGYAASDGSAIGTAVGAAVGGVGMAAPFGVFKLAEGGGLLSSVVTGVLGMAGVNVMQTLLDPLPAWTVGKGYNTPTASDLVEAAIGGGLAGSIFGPIAHLAGRTPIKVLNPEVPGGEVTASQLIDATGASTPIHDAAMRHSLADPETQQLLYKVAAGYEPGEPKPPAVPAPAGIGPDIPDGHIRLYRVEGGNRLEPQGEGAGRWFSHDWNSAQFYINDAGDGARISYIDVPSAEAEKYRVSNIPLKPPGSPENPGEFSHNPEREFFLPKDLAAIKTDLDLSAKSPQEVRSQIESVSKSYDAAGGIVHYFKALGFELSQDESGALTLHHGTGVVFAAEPGAPFGRFQLQKVNSGEGAQLYSWGLYFAQDPKIAGWYKKADLARKGTDEGSLFTVHVDADPHHFLDWDKPLKDQPSNIQASVQKAIKDFSKFGEKYPGARGEDVYHELMRQHGATADEVATMKGSAAKLASEHLLSEGVRGMRFADANSRGLPAAQQTFNHVLYDAGLIKITHRNGQSVPNTLMSTLMPILQGPINRMGTVVNTISTGLTNASTPAAQAVNAAKVVLHHVNMDARGAIIRNVLTNSGRGIQNLQVATKAMDPFLRLMVPHLAEFKEAYESRDPVRISNSVIGNFYEYTQGRSSGATLATSELRGLADTIRTYNMAMAARLEQYAQDDKITFLGGIEDYVRQAWKDRRGPAWDAFREKVGLGKTGSGQSLNPRKYPTIMDGLLAGLTPRYDNPIEMFLYDMRQKNMFLATLDIKEEAKLAGYAYHSPGPKVPTDIELKSTRFTTDKGVNIAMWAPEGLAKPYNLWLDMGFMSERSTASMYEKALYAANTLTALKLILPTFHAVVVTAGSAVSAFQRGWQELGRGQYGPALWDMTKAATFVLPIITDVKLGMRLGEKYALGDFDGRLNGLREAGLNIGHRQSVYGTATRSMQQAYHSVTGTSITRSVLTGDTEAMRMGGAQIFKDFAGDWKAAMGDKDTELLQERFFRGLYRVPLAPVENMGRIMQSISAPLFDTIIPAAKLAAAYRNLDSWLKANQGATEETRWAKQREIVKDVDNRYGELNQDTLFWRKWIKQSVNLTTISLGWTYGTWRGVGAAFGIDMANESGKGRINQWNPTSALGLAGTAIMYMYANAVMQYLHGQPAPWNTDTPWRDLIDYRTGGVSKYGTPARGGVPSELKEVYDVAKAIKFAVGVGAPTQALPALGEYALGKLNPLFGIMRDLGRGTDAMGHHIAFGQGWWNYLLHQGLSPIFVEQLKQLRPASAITQAEAMMGFKEASQMVEDPAGYSAKLGKLGDRWTKEEVGRARKEDPNYTGGSTTSRSGGSSRSNAGSSSGLSREGGSDGYWTKDRQKYEVDLEKTDRLKMDPGLPRTSSTRQFSPRDWQAFLNARSQPTSQRGYQNVHQFSPHELQVYNAERGRAAPTSPIGQPPSATILRGGQNLTARPARAPQSLPATARPARAQPTPRQARPSRTRGAQ